MTTRCSGVTWHGGQCLFNAMEGAEHCAKHLRKLRLPYPTPVGRGRPDNVQSDATVRYTRLLGEYGWWPRPGELVKVADLKPGFVYLDEEGLPVVITQFEGTVDGHRFWRCRYIWQAPTEVSWPEDMPRDALVWLAQKMEPYT